ncbi:MAG: hypothetical protein AAGG09_22330 [Pseudomonadota bacterium]
MVDPSSLTLPARRIQIVMTCSLVLLSASMAGLVVAAATMPVTVGETLARLGGFAAGPMAAWQSAALTGIAAMHLAVWIVLFGVARLVFAHMADGAPDLAARTARTLSHWLWAMLAWGVTSQMIVSVVATWGLGEGERALHLGIGTSELFVALSALIAGFMARAFALGAELWQDHREVV